MAVKGVFQNWIYMIGGAKAAALKLKVTEDAVFRWLRRNRQPNPENIKRLVQASRGVLTRTQILADTAPKRAKKGGI